MRFPQNFIKAKPSLQNSLRPTNFAENITGGVSEGPRELGETVLAFSAHCCQGPSAEGCVRVLPGCCWPCSMSLSQEEVNFSSRGRWRRRRCDALPPTLSPGSPEVSRQISAGRTASPREGAFLQRGWQKLCGCNFLKISPIVNRALQWRGGCSFNVLLTLMMGWASPAKPGATCLSQPLLIPGSKARCQHRQN